MLAFSQASGLWLLLQAEFLAMTLVLVYLGAVMVLFLFVVMMLDINLDTLREGFWKHFPLAASLGALIALEMAAVLMSGFRTAEAPKVALAVGQLAPELSNTKALGILLYTEYLMPIQVAAAILLVAMIAAIALTLRERKDTKAISASEQVHVRASDRLVVLKMDAVKVGEAPKAPEAPAEGEAAKETK
jgi:NADH-quinone oxidoreductase subunit J